ncbi:MAG: hypothetical protein ISS82_03550 [Nanoarchaeota archaeon]|nr:hypothetical protein [Nanoarchaeota archaeon]
MSALKGSFKIIVGILLVIIALWVAIVNLFGWNWGQATLDLIKGGIILAIIFVGLIFLILGFTDFKE